MFTPLYHLGLLSCGIVLAALLAAALTGALAAALTFYYLRHKLRGPAGPMGQPGRDGRDADQYALQVLTELRARWRKEIAQS